MKAKTLSPYESSSLPAIVGGVPVRPQEQRLVFGAPVIGEEEISAVVECLRSRWIGAGPGVERFEREFALYKGAPYAAALSSGTAALHLSLIALGIGPGDEVIAPAMTFCASIHAIVHTGATPILVDCERSTFNLDPALVERRINARTKAIMVVHMGGRCCNMDPIIQIARRHGLRVIEDCAHAIESNYHGTPSGLMGDVGCFSFYPTKNVTAGEGGMVITADRRLFRRVKLLSQQGMTVDPWTRSVRGYSGHRVIVAGYKANLTDIGACLALAQLAQVGERWKRRHEVWQTYSARLAQLPVCLPAPVEAGTRHAHHLYSLVLLPEKLRAGRKEVIAALAAENIGTGIHYVPVHMQPYYRRRFGFVRADFPNAAWLGENTLSIPLSPALSEGDVSDVCNALTRVLGYYAADAKPYRSQANEIGVLAGKSVEPNIRRRVNGSAALP